MKWLSNFSIKKLFSNKKFAVSFSVVVAFIFWLVIVIDQNPDREITFTGVPVSLSAVGTNLEGLNMEIVSHNVGESVSVSVKGPSYVVSALKSDDLMVTADFSGIDKTGDYVLNLVAKRISGKNDYEIVSINPSTVSLTVDKIVDEYMDIEVSAPNVTIDVNADVGLGIEPMKVEDKIHIKGPQAEFRKIAKVMAVVDETATLNTSKTFNAKIKLFDMYGDEIDSSKFVLSADNVQVTAKVYKKVSLPVKPAFINKPISAPDIDYEVKLSSGEVISEIDVQGDPEVINTLSFVELEAIDFTKLSNLNKHFELKLNLFTESIKTSDNIEKVFIDFDLSKYGQKDLAVDIEVINATEGITIDRDSLKNVMFTVPISELKSFKSSSVKATVDLSGKNIGDSVAVEFASDVKNSWVNGSYSVTVKAK